MSKTVHIKNNRPRIYTAAGLDLHPGLNKVDETKAKEFLANPIIKVKVERGFIEVVKTVKNDDDAAAKAAEQAAADKAKADAKEKADKEAAEAKAAQEKADAEKAEADAAQAKADKEKAEADAAAKAAAESGNDGESEDEQPEPPYGIKGLNADDSIAKIKVIEDTDYLMRVVKREDRKTVKTAAQDRILQLQGEQ